ncbi:acylphosphatase [Halalkalibacter sp. APA_J-10(15)]|uniref:acylphosphatase n=1 Tax=Halalkalibacter sp. APA_J-10(15) TaxID=2933805 RepID=UPI001FF202E6|nr:acylphosphatase [Halalkalibacter sp. APA_J-10(15)]MCK0470260.1 acylphosphatase [Halalkalibacter sp. APA_J-10(15)]
MEKKDKATTTWLEHLEGAIPLEAYGDQLSMYTIALEGWRRGLELTFYHLREKRKDKNVIRYLLKSKERTHYFSYSKGDKITSEAIKACRSKELTRECLVKHNVPTPIGKSFPRNYNKEEVLEFIDEIDFPVVVKQMKGSLGKGVFVNITDIDTAFKAIQYNCEVMNSEDFIIEKHVDGDECRVYVIEDKVIAAVKRVPANIVGDGKSTIKDLVEKKNILRKENPNLYKRLIKLDDQALTALKELNYNEHTILSEGEIVFLKETSNLSSGGDPIEVTNHFSPELEKIAISAAKAVGMNHCGLDMIIDFKKNTGYVIEVNSRAHLGAFLYPIKGVARDVPRAIVDHYFPETKNNPRTDLIFDYETIVNLFKEGKVYEYTLPSLTISDFIKKKVFFNTKTQSKSLKVLIRNLALKLKLNGYVENSNEGIEVQLAGSKENIESFLREFHTNSIFVDEINNINVEESNSMIVSGFSIRENNSLQEKTVNLQRHVGVLKRKNKKLHDKNHILNDKNHKLNAELKTIKHEYKKLSKGLIRRIINKIRNRK